MDLSNIKDLTDQIEIIWDAETYVTDQDQMSDDAAMVLAESNDLMRRVILLILLDETVSKSRMLEYFEIAQEIA